VKECDKIESLLWEYPDISQADEERLVAHLANCPACKNALAIISVIRESRKIDTQKVSIFNATSFDESVMGKIRRQRVAPIAESDSRKFVVQIVVPIGLAASIVFFMILSISDLGNLPAFKDLGVSQEVAPGKKYEIINIRLTPETAPKEAPILSESPSAEDKKPIKKEFSILAKPVTAPSPDSVSIEAVYLTDETVPFISQQTRASISEVVVDTGLVQSRQAPAGMLVTVERMPRPINLVLPEYPVWAKKRGFSGEVWIKARIDEEGKVTEAYIISSNFPSVGFEEAALEAAKKSSYLPAESNGLRLPVWIMYPVRFIYKE